MDYIDISNHPQESLNIKRKAKVSLLEYDTDSEYVRIKIRVKHYDQNDIPVAGMNDIYPTLTADKSHWVNNSGELVDINDPTAIMTEYDFFVSLEEVPILIGEWFANKILWADELGRLNVY